VRARHDERARVDAVLHDTVLATLMLASRVDGHVDPELRRQAADAVAALEADPPGGGEGDVDPVQVLRERLARLDPVLSVTTSAVGYPMPRRIVDALVDAAVEAARNSLRHAELPPGQAPSVTLDQGPGRIRIIVADAGVGFTPSHVATGRLGLRSSIHGRLARIPGATALVDSQPGAGTRVELTWEDPQ
jgi:signal transduction histidine kinase